MKPRAVALLAAEGVSVDQFTGRLTLFNLVDQVFTAGEPAVLARLNVVVIYELGDEGAEIPERLEILAPDGSPVATSETLIVAKNRSVGEAPSEHRSIHFFWHMVLPKRGDYSLLLRHQAENGEWVEVSRRRFAVTAKAHPLFPKQERTSEEPPPPAAKVG